MSKGQLFQMQLRVSRESREAALKTIWEKPNGDWTVRIGGRMRGTTRTFASRRACEAAVAEHYNAALFKTMMRARAAQPKSRG